MILGAEFLFNEQKVHSISKNILTIYDKKIKLSVPMYNTTHSTPTVESNYSFTPLPTTTDHVTSAPTCETNTPPSIPTLLENQDKIQNYFSGIANAVIHPGENNNCAVQPPQTSSGQ